MWKSCFPQDTDRFIRFYFDKVYKNDETLVYVENDELVASLQMIPHRIKTSDSFCWGGYISGAMTHPGYRKKGYMARLLNASFDYMREKGYVYTFLIPQEEYLVDYYKKFGFENASPERLTSYHRRTAPLFNTSMNIYTDLSTIDFPALYSAFSHYLMEKTNVALKSESQFSNMLWDFFDGKGVLFTNDEGFAFTSKRGKTIVLSEFFYRNEEVKTGFLHTICDYYSLEETIIYNDPSIPITRYKGMIKSLNESIESKTDIYIGRMFE
jgi:predicted acetyltransferase